MGELTAPLVSGLKGTLAATLPEISTEQVLAINRRVAKEIGITRPDGLLNMASHFIQ